MINRFVSVHRCTRLMALWLTLDSCSNLCVRFEERSSTIPTNGINVKVHCATQSLEEILRCLQFSNQFRGVFQLWVFDVINDEMRAFGKYYLLLWRLLIRLANQITLKESHWLTQHVFTCFFYLARKEILHKVSGTFPSGNLIAIMGPSGAGTYWMSKLGLFPDYSITFSHE